MEITIRIPEGDKCFEPDYNCPCWSLTASLWFERFDVDMVSRCGLLNKEWKGASMVRNPKREFNKHPDCPYYKQEDKTKVNVYWQQVSEQLNKLEGQIGSIKRIYHESIVQPGEVG